MYMEGCYEKIGGPTRPSRSTRASSESANRAEVTLLKDSRCLAVLSASPGKKFVVPVPDRSPDILMAVIDAQIEPGTTVTSDCWGAYHDLDAQVYTHTAPSTTAWSSLTSVLPPTQTQSRALGGM